MLRELRARTRLAIDEFPLPDEQGQWQQVLHRMVSSYLVHHGYCSTAQAFSRGTGQPIQEDIASIKNRQKVSKLVMSGRIGEAIELTRRQWPGLLERDHELLFLLKCRQFVEMVNGSDAQLCDSPSGSCGNGVATSVISHTSRAPQPNGDNHIPHTNGTTEPMDESRSACGDVEMSPPPANGAHDEDADGCSSRASVERMLAFGRDLYAMSQKLQQDLCHKMLENAFSLLAYSNPWDSPVGWQLEPVQRESVCEALNSAILEGQGMAWRSPVEENVAHLRDLLQRMSRAALGSCAFADLPALLRH